MAEQSIRFGIKENNFRGATWKLFSVSGKDDIYLACRELRGTLKVSMHESGSWHFGFSKDAYEKYFEESDSSKKRYIEIWKRPDQVEEGLTIAFRIITPFFSISSPIENFDKKVKWINNCGEGYATEIFITITSLPIEIINQPNEEENGIKLVGFYQLSGGEFVSVLYKYIGMPDFSNAFPLRDGRLFKGVKKEAIKLANRAIAFGDNLDGSRTIYDFSVVTTN